jgi:hypothetical protein
VVGDSAVLVGSAGPAVLAGSAESAVLVDSAERIALVDSAAPVETAEPVVPGALGRFGEQIEAAEICQVPENAEYARSPSGGRSCRSGSRLRAIASADGHWLNSYGKHVPTSSSLRCQHCCDKDPIQCQDSARILGMTLTEK